MNAKKLINEVFDTGKSEEPDWAEAQPDAWTGKKVGADFFIGNKAYSLWMIPTPASRVQAVDSSADPEKQFMTVEFRLDSKPEGGANRYDWPYGILGTGNAFQVMGQVINMVLKYVFKFKPDGLYFSAEEPSRKRLYKHIVDRMQNRFPWISVKTSSFGDFLVNLDWAKATAQAT